MTAARATTTHGSIAIFLLVVVACASATPTCEGDCDLAEAEEASVLLLQAGLSLLSSREGPPMEAGGPAAPDARPLHDTSDPGDEEAVASPEGNQTQCNVDTGSWCHIKPCSKWYGPRECHNVGGNSRHCVCLPGFCVDKSGYCVAAARTVTANVLPCRHEPGHGLKWCELPPEQTGARLGLTSSGGGARALSFFVGVLRGLTQLGVMKQVDLLTAISGSSWVSAIYTFANSSDEELLGKPTRPEELTMEFLKTKDSKIGAAASVGSLSTIGEILITGVPSDKLWTELIAKTFLEPFGLHQDGAYMAQSEEEVMRIKQENPDMHQARFITPRPLRPALVVEGTLLAPNNYAGAADSAVSLQMSPGYTGSPSYPNNSAVVYHGRKQGQAEVEHVVGGGFIETFAFGGVNPEDQHDQTSGGRIKVGAPRVPFTLADMVGVSSWDPGAQLSHSVATMTNPLAWYWPVSSPRVKGPTRATSYSLVDGGSIDSSGLIMQIQRNVPKIIWVANSYKGLNESYTWDDVCRSSPSMTFDPVAAGVLDQVVDKFGYGAAVTDSAYYLVNNQIFEKSELLPIACKLWSLKKDGKPSVVHFRSRVLTNQWWGIHGGLSVEVVLVYLARSVQFDNLLPPDTQQELAKGADGEFKGWPHYRTTFLNPPEPFTYHLQQINLLSALGEYTVRESADLFRVMAR